MKKLYSFLLATAISTTAFAETPVDGNWEFTVYQIEGETLDPNELQESTINLTASSIGNEVYWNINGTSYGFLGSYYVDDVSATPYCRFEASSDYDEFAGRVKGPNGTSVMQYSFYVDGSDFTNKQLFAEYDAESQSFNKFYRQGVYNGFANAKEAQIGFELKENGKTFRRYIIISAKKVAGTEEQENYIKVDLYDNGSYPKVSKYGTGYYLSERLDVTAVGYDSFKVLYTITEKDGTVFKENQQADNLGGSTYGIDVLGVPANKEYVLTAWAESGEYKSEEATLEFNTIEKSVTIELANEAPYPFTFEDYDNPTKAAVVEIANVTYTGFSDYSDFKVYFKIDLKDEAEVVGKTEAETDDGETYIMYGYGLDFNKTYALTAWAEASNFTSDEVTIEFATPTRAITLGEITNDGASFRVASANHVGFEDEDPADVYFGLKGYYTAHEKATYNEADGSYTYTFPSYVTSGSYTAQIYGGKGDYLDMDNMVEVPFTVSDTTAIEDITADGADANARYYNLNGVEVKNLNPGTVYIKVADGKASKVLVK